MGQKSPWRVIEWLLIFHYIAVTVSVVTVPSTWVVKVRIVPASGAALTAKVTSVSGGQAASDWDAQLALLRIMCANDYYA